MRHFAIGFEVEPSDIWREVTPMPRKPKTTKQETFDAKLPELLEEQRQCAIDYPLSGKITEMAVANIDGGYVTKIAPTLAALMAVIAPASDVVLYGVDIRLRMRQLALLDPYPAGAGAVLASDHIDMVDIITAAGLRPLGVALSQWLVAIRKIPSTASGAVAEAANVAVLVNTYGMVAHTRTHTDEQ
jgi:hypothetical protein